MENDVQEYRHVILDMCLHNRAVDYFFEGTHASYLHKLLGRLTDRDFYTDHILASLADAGDDQDAVHRFFLARLLAQDGNPRARGLMYQYFCPGKAYGETIAMDFVEMDGLEGLRFVASKIPNPIAGGLILHRACEQFGERAVSEYFAHPCIPTPNPRAKLRRWGREAVPEEFVNAAKRFRDDPNPGQLPIFLDRPYPLPPAPLLELAPHSGDAVLALAHIRHPAVRELAFQLIATNAPHRGHAARLLWKNYEPGDIDIVLSWFLAEADPATRHHLGIALRQQTDAHHLHIYEHTPCSECRSYVVADLIERNSLPPAYRAECLYDANETTRSLAWP
ncbi:MAG: HEAT repeat domain-containing protein [Bryobacterales bacterium]|nr:HEAT repeat domain-containing protein [Bryobacterales bacterium]